MRAALLEASEKPLAVVDDVDIEEPRAGEVLVRVTHCGVCHSDLSLAERHVPVHGARPCSATKPRASSKRSAPASPRSRPATRSCSLPIPSCNECYWCVRGEYGCCVNAASLTTGTLLDGHTPLSRHGQPVLRGVGLGGFAEYVITTASGAVKVADDTPLEVACVIGCAVQTGVGAVLNTARVVPEGATVLVVGAGGIGIAIVQGARIAGASRIIVSDPSPTRRENAKQFGATDVVDPTADDVVGVVSRAHRRHRRRLRVRRGRLQARSSRRASGRPATAARRCWSARAASTRASRSRRPVMFTMSERKLIGCLLGSCNGRRDIPRLLDLWRAGRLDLEGMITARRPLDEINEAFDDMTAGRGLRTVLTI